MSNEKIENIWDNLKLGDEVTCIFSNAYIWHNANGKVLFSDICQGKVVGIFTDLVRIKAYDLKDSLFLFKDKIENIDGKWFYSHIENENENE